MSSSTRDYSTPEIGLDDEIFAPRSLETSSLEQDLNLYPTHHNLRMLSHSGILNLHSCPRKFELNRMLPRPEVQEDEDGHLAFGTVVGNGIQEFLVSGDKNKALFRVFCDWKESIDADTGERSSKTFWHALRAVEKFLPFRHSYLSQYKLAVFHGKPACELGFDIDFGDGFHYRGKLDALLIHSTKQEFLVLECKTTGSYKVDEAMYKNSGQALGYGLVVDKIAADLGLSNSYNVLYPVYLTRNYEWREFQFPKSSVQRATWLQSILFDAQRIQQHAELDYFPMYGESCFSFGRQCQYFGICQLSNDVLLRGSAAVLKKDKEEEYPFKFSIEELIAAQLSS